MSLCAKQMKQYRQWRNFTFWAPYTENTMYGPRPGDVLQPFPAATGPLDPSTPALRGVRGGSYTPGYRLMRKHNVSVSPSCICDY